MITIVGASGNTGRAATEHLLTAGHRIRVVGRREAALAPFVARGAEAAVGEVTDREFLKRAFAGAEAAYVLVPPHYTTTDFIGHYAAAAEAFAAALDAAGVPHVVVLSSLGAELSSGAGLIGGVHQLEARLGAVRGLNVRFLRPGTFYTNHLGSLGLIAGQGINGGAEPPDVRLPAIDPEDIGRFAAQDLIGRGFTGVSVRELLGPRDVSPREATSILGTAIGRPDLAYVQFPPADYAAALVGGAGFSREVAALFVEMSEALSSGRVHAHQPRTPENTGLRTLNQFAADVFAPAYAGLELKATP